MVPAAYIGTILIWSTTPLAIKWSGEGVTPLFGVSARMMLGAVLCLGLVYITRTVMPWNRQALTVYFAASIGIFGSMMSVYWGAQYVPSGVIAVFFGLTPVITALLAKWHLDEQSSSFQWLGMILSIAGLALIFRTTLIDSQLALAGLFAVLIAVFLHSLSTVVLKGCQHSLTGLSVTSGALVVSVPMYLLSWWFFDGVLPDNVPNKAMVSIVYLGVIGSVLGFVLYYYALSKLKTAQIALIPVLTPFMALLLGNVLNNESLTVHTVFGVTIIMTGLVFHQWDSLRTLMRNKSR